MACHISSTRVWAGAAFAAIVALSAWLSPAPASQPADDPQQPKLIVMAEKRFGDFFLFVTDDSRHYDLLQQVQTRTGLPDKPALTCFMRQCFLTIGSATAERLNEASAADLLDRLRDVQTDYRALRRADAGERVAAAARWHGDIDGLSCALRKGETC